MNAKGPDTASTEEISGLIERVTFHNEENGFCVLKVKVRGHRDEETALGSLPSVSAGEWLEAEGWWVRDKEHELQFKARLMKTVPPTTVEGIEQYLSSGLVKGIGPVLAKKLVGRFGVEVCGAGSWIGFRSWAWTAMQTARVNSKADLCMKTLNASCSGPYLRLANPLRHRISSPLPTRP